MEQKEEVWPKMVFVSLLALAFSGVYLFGPKATGFFVYKAPEITGNGILLASSVMLLVGLFAVITELMVKLR